MVRIPSMLWSVTGSGASNVPKFLSGEWGIHSCYLEGAVKVTAPDECPLVSVEVHLIAISLILVLEGCHEKEISFHLVHSPGCLLVCGYLWLYGLLSSCRSVHRASISV